MLTFHLFSLLFRDADHDDDNDDTDEQSTREKTMLAKRYNYATRVNSTWLAVCDKDEPSVHRDCRVKVSHHDEQDLASCRCIIIVISTKMMVVVGAVVLLVVLHSHRAPWAHYLRLKWIELHATPGLKYCPYCCAGCRRRRRWRLRTTSQGRLELARRPRSCRKSPERRKNKKKKKLPGLVESNNGQHQRQGSCDMSRPSPGRRAAPKQVAEKRRPRRSSFAIEIDGRPRKSGATQTRQWPLCLLDNLDRMQRLLEARPIEDE